MDMDNMDMDPTVAYLPLSDPRCVKAADGCMAFADAAAASQASTPFVGQFAYGRYVTYYWVIILGLVFIFHALQRIRDLKDPISRRAEGKKPGLWKKTKAAARFVFYRQFTQPRGDFGLPSFAYTGLIALTTIFITALVFAERPYYRPQLGFGAPPIAIRTGLMAFACVPILVALAGKANIVTLFTGISHEKLNVLHRWVAWISFVLSLIHTIPFFYASLTDPGDGGSSRVKTEFYFWGTVIGASEYSGVPPLAILFAMCVLSLPQVRGWAYETFYGLHILLSITYLGLLFWHAMNMEDSWAYLWATVAVWGASWLARAFWKHQSTNLRGEWFQSSVATVREVGGEVTRIEVWPREQFNWAPGQHVFLRFTKLAPLENHPFTIASAPLAIRKSVEGKSAEHQHNFAAQPNPLVFLVRSHSGFTRRLLAHATLEKAADSNTTPVLIDGPYGSVKRPLEKIYDTVILTAGGTGITACLPWLLQLVALAQNCSPYLRTRKVVLVWAIRHIDAFTWIETALLEALTAQVKGLEIVLRVHVTGAHESAAIEKADPTSKVTKGEVNEDTIDVTREDDTATRIAELGSLVIGRPHFAGILDENLRDGNNVVLGCGPEGFKIDLANAVAAAQTKVFRGECNEIAMHLETFDW